MCSHSSVEHEQAAHRQGEMEGETNFRAIEVDLGDFVHGLEHGLCPREIKFFLQIRISPEPLDYGEGSIELGSLELQRAFLPAPQGRE